MELSPRCIHNFSRRDWQRGEQYYRSGAVEFVVLDDQAIEAEVWGSSDLPYEVRLLWNARNPSTLDVACTCPRFADVGLCKHVAAVIQAADDLGVGLGVPGKHLLDVGEYLPDLDDASLDAGDWSPADPQPVAGFLSNNARSGGRSRRRQPARPESTRNWKTDLKLVFERQASELETRGGFQPSRVQRLWYVLDVDGTIHRGRPCIALWHSSVKKDGAYGKLKSFKLTREEAVNFSAEEDRQLLALLLGNEYDNSSGYSFMGASYFKFSDFRISPAVFDFVLPRLCVSGRFGWQSPDHAGSPLPIQPFAWDDGDPWKFKLQVDKSDDQKHWRLQGQLVRGSETVRLDAPLVLLKDGLAIFRDRIARFDPGDCFQWVAALRHSGALHIPVKQEQDFVEQVVHMPVVPACDWPSELAWREKQLTPRPRLVITKPADRWSVDLSCHLTFRYEDRVVSGGDITMAWYDRDARCALRRDLAAERAAEEQLVNTGARRSKYRQWNTQASQYSLARKQLSRCVLTLTAAGWEVEAEGKLTRAAGAMSLHVSSGVDWFDLEGRCDYGEASASLPQLLAAARRGEQFVQLDDGSQGILPDGWLQRYAGLIELGQSENGQVRFLPTQAILLDALLAAQETDQVSVDKQFARTRNKLRNFTGIKPRSEPKSFAGTLRPYQREGLGWLHFLDEYQFGGCLADDMGLGKTVQVLALLEGQRSRRGKPPSSPSLVVVPRSLVFNWIEEARRFTPKLRVLDYTGLQRRADLDHLDNYDLVVTTYGTLRRDIADLRNVTFNYAILDEAQAIKNASSQSAKACRLIQSRRRLAITGTPIENHLGELWSLFEFLNPGMLGRNSQLHAQFSSTRAAANGANAGTQPAAEDVAILSQTVRPFMLRRTKQQVLTELPPKTEQTLYCELDAAERKAYNELRNHYRDSLLQRIEKVGIRRSKIHVLEALLRLRQAACHVGLLDKKKATAGSSKLESLLEQLAEVIDEGHKALVFSQFTSFLAIVRRQLDTRKICYEYLDGKTTKRQAKVERFQTDPKCQLFLISLKAGGQGLNLTAADYVFILDPWWNPAAEAQAVDRAHRIGQDRHVFAYRLIARETVEERIVELQAHKRALADAIISADSSPLGNLTAEDLQRLLA